MIGVKFSSYFEMPIYWFWLILRYRLSNDLWWQYKFSYIYCHNEYCFYFGSKCVCVIMYESLWMGKIWMVSSPSIECYNIPSLDVELFRKYQSFAKYFLLWTIGSSSFMKKLKSLPHLALSTFIIEWSLNINIVSILLRLLKHL